MNRPNAAFFAAILLLTTAACGGDDPVTPGPSLPDKQWNWIDVPGSQCGNGSQTGMGINPNSTSKKLVIWLQGGGACYNEGNCLSDEPATSYFNGFGTAEFQEFVDGRSKQGHLARDEDDNPFKDFNMAFVPYCTGDVHAGNRVMDGKMHFKGQHNLKLFLAKLVETFPDAEQVVLTGSSAGGFGTMFNFWLFADAYPNADVTWIDDSGPLLPMKTMAALIVVIPAWGLKDTIYPGCSNCMDSDDPNGGPHNLITAYGKDYPNTRGSLLSSYRDDVIVNRFLIEETALEAALKDLATTTAPTNPNFRYFYLEGDHHVWLDGDETSKKLSDVKSGDASLKTFVQQQVDDDANWANVQP